MYFSIGLVGVGSPKISTFYSLVGKQVGVGDRRLSTPLVFALLCTQPLVLFLLVDEKSHVPVDTLRC